MKRKIKFRGKRLDDGKWIYGYLADEDYINNINKIDMMSEEVESNTVGQFTGKFDSKGDEIFEDDIVCSYVFCENEEGKIIEFWRVGVIEYVKGAFFLTKAKNYTTEALDELCDTQPSTRSTHAFPAYRSIIIGNIHDNPELLKQ